MVSFNYKFFSEITDKVFGQRTNDVVANIMGVSVYSVSKYRNNKFYPHASRLNALIKAIRETGTYVEISDFYERENLDNDKEIQYDISDYSDLSREDLLSRLADSIKTIRLQKDEIEKLKVERTTYVNKIRELKREKRISKEKNDV